MSEQENPFKGLLIGLAISLPFCAGLCFVAAFICACR